MDINTIHKGSCFDLAKDIPRNSIDLVITSPPYSDIKKYGEGFQPLHPDNYVDWIFPLFKELEKSIKSSGSIVFNIDDKCYKKLRHTYIFDLILKINNETNLKLYDYYFWEKESFLPNGGITRVNHNIEWLLHFVIDKDKVKWNMDSVREPYSEGSLKRFKSKIKKYDTDKDGIKNFKNNKKHDINEKGKLPSCILRFPTNAITKGNKHPAPFHRDLPIWFIKALTDKGDLVLDPFMGSGTTACAAIEMGRNWMGFELNQEYIDIAYEYIDTEYKKIQNKNTYKNFF